MIKTKEQCDIEALIMNPPVKVLESLINFKCGLHVTKNPTNNGYTNMGRLKAGINRTGIITAIKGKYIYVAWLSKGNKRYHYEWYHYSILTIKTVDELK